MDPPTPGTGPEQADLELGGLARTDHAGWGGEFDDLCEKLLTDSAVLLLRERACEGPFGRPCDHCRQ